MYNNRIYIEKFYCTYILRITSVSTRLLRLEPDNHTLNILTSGCISIQAAPAVPGPSVSVRFLKYVHTTDDLTYKNRCCLVS